MITTVHTCRKCRSANLVRNGKNKSGTPTYHCKDCKSYGVLYKKKAIDTEAVFRTYEERNSYRSTARIFKISHVTVFNLLKKKPKAQHRLKPVLRRQPPIRRQKWMRYLAMYCSKSIKSAFGSSKIDKTGKSFLFLLAMAVCKVVNDFGANYLMIIYAVKVFPISGSLTTACLLKHIGKWEKNRA